MKVQNLKSHTLENPTLTQKVSKLLAKSSNRGLREEQIHQDTINRLMGGPVQLVRIKKSKEREWPVLRVANS